MKELSMQEKVKIAKAEYARKWREKNRQRNKEIQDRHWAKKYDELVQAGEIENAK